MMFPTGTPEQDLLETLLEIERTRPAERTPEESAQMEILETWYVDTGRLWGCRCYEDVWRQDFDWRPRSAWTIAARDHAIKVIRAARFAFVLARVPERLGAYRADGLERWLLMRAREQLQS